MELADLFILLMHSFQEENKVKGKCVDNALYLHARLKTIGVHTKFKAVIAVSIEERRVCAGHIVLEGPGLLFEASHCEASMQNVKYFDNFSKFLSCKPDKSLTKDVLNMFIHFSKIAERLNDGAFLVDRDYYDKQADYLEKNLGRTINQN